MAKDMGQYNSITFLLLVYVIASVIPPQSTDGWLQLTSPIVFTCIHVIRQCSHTLCIFSFLIKAWLCVVISYTDVMYIVFLPPVLTFISLLVA